MNSFSPQQRTALGQLHPSSADCPDFSLEAEANQFYRPQRFSAEREWYGVVAQRVVYALLAFVLLGLGLAALDRFAFLYMK